MSEGDKTGADRNHGQYGGGGGGAAPRQPNSITQSKVLNIIKNQKEQPQPQPDQAGNAAELAQQIKTEGTMRQLSLPIAPSGLSADAAVFIPMAMQKPKPQPANNTGYSDEGYYYSGQEGDYAYEEGVDYYLGNNFGELTLEDTYDSDQPFYSSNYSQATIEGRFDLALKILTTNPTNHEEYLKPICDEIEQTSAYERVIPIMVENLYLQCILEENFRYIGARICQYLNSSLKMDPNFIKRFVKRCQVDFEKREQFISGPQEDQKKLQGLGMLLAEIFLNVETSGTDGVPQRLGFLPTILIKTAKTLLSKPEDANIKCGCQMLKLSGSLIEDVVKNIPDQCVEFEGLFESLKTLSTNTQISENAKFHVEKIVKLKDNGWDTSLPAASSNIFNPYAQNPYYGAGGFRQEHDPVYYDSPGKDSEDSVSHLLTEEEEADFLAWQYDGFKQDSDMGLEMEEAYEEFLSQQASSSYNSYQGSSQSSGSKSSVSKSATSNAPAPEPYRYYNPQHHQSAPPSHHQHHNHHNHYGGSGGNYCTQDNHYQQQHYTPQYDPMPQQQQHPQQYANSQYGHHPPPQQMPPPMPHQQHPQYHHQHQQQYQHQSQQQQQQPPRYSSHNPPPQNDPYHYRR